METEFGLRITDLNSICAILKMYAEVEQAVIFGSRAKGTFKRGSDVDIALKGTQLTSEILAQIRYELNEETNMPYHFDLLHYDTIAEPALKAHIGRLGRIIYKKETKG